MVWMWIFSYFVVVVSILKYHEALTTATISEFLVKFKRLVDEMSVYFEPCGFPIELVAKFCIEKLPKTK